MSHHDCLPCGPRSVSRAGIAILAALFVLACGANEHAIIDAADAGPNTQVNTDVNLCPHFDSSLVLPQRIPPKVIALVIVTATDPDAEDSQLAYAWTAPSGTFSFRDRPMTNYTCSALGPEQLSVTAEDHAGCISLLTIAVECVGN